MRGPDQYSGGAQTCRQLATPSHSGHHLIAPLPASRAALSSDHHWQWPPHLQPPLELGSSAHFSRLPDALSSFPPLSPPPPPRPILPASTAPPPPLRFSHHFPRPLPRHPHPPLLARPPRPPRHAHICDAPGRPVDGRALAAAAAGGECGAEEADGERGGDRGTRDG